MNNHGSKPSKLDSLIKSSRCRYRNVRPHSLPAESHSFVGMARETAAMPPASKIVQETVWQRPLETGCDTHNKPKSARSQGSEKAGFFFKNRLHACRSCPFWA